MEIIIAMIVYGIVLFTISFMVEKDAEFERLMIFVLIFIVYVTAGVCGTYKGKREMREEAVKNGAAKWVVHVDPVTGKTTDREFKWLSSKEKGKE